jgi:hypothetical protein
VSTVVRNALDTYEKLKTARQQYKAARTPANFFVLVAAEARFRRANRTLAVAAIMADSEKLAA